MGRPHLGAPHMGAPYIGNHRYQGKPLKTQFSKCARHRNQRTQEKITHKGETLTLICIYIYTSETSFSPFVLAPARPGTKNVVKIVRCGH